MFKRFRSLILKVLIDHKVIQVKMYPFNFIPLQHEEVYCVIDIGANIGSISLAALRSFPNANVYAFEPLSELIPVITDKCARYSDRLYIKNIALGEVAQNLTINISNSPAASSFKPRAKSYIQQNPCIKTLSRREIRVEKLDDQENLITPDVVKIDVEGFEYEVIRGGAQLLSKAKCIIIEISLCNDQDVQNQAFLRIYTELHNLGFFFYGLYDYYYAKGKSNIASGASQFDAIFMNRRSRELAMPGLYSNTNQAIS